MQRATLSQVRAGRGGRLIEIEADVLDVCWRIQEIDPALGVDYNETGGFFRVYQLIDGEKRTVTTATELTPQIVETIQRVAHPGYDLAAELDRLDEQADRDQQHAFTERIGEAGERLFHAVRKDLGVKDSIWVPGSARDAA